MKNRLRQPIITGYNYPYGVKRSAVEFNNQIIVNSFILTENSQGCLVLMEHPMALVKLGSGDLPANTASIALSR